MRAILTESSGIEVVDGSDPTHEIAGGSRQRTAETEADRARRQQQRRRKTKLARHALAAHRTR